MPRRPFARFALSDLRVPCIRRCGSWCRRGESNSQTTASEAARYASSRHAGDRTCNLGADGKIVAHPKNTDPAGRPDLQKVYDVKELPIPSGPGNAPVLSLKTKDPRDLRSTGVFRCSGSLECQSALSTPRTGMTHRPPAGRRCSSKSRCEWTCAIAARMAPIVLAVVQIVVIVSS